MAREIVRCQIIRRRTICGVSSARVTPAEKIRAQVKRKREVYENYRAYLAKRIEEEDWHGAWDASVNLSETSCYIDGLEFALAAIEES